MREQTCSKCQTTKELSEFYLNSNNKPYRHCKKCHSKFVKKRPLTKIDICVTCKGEKAFNTNKYCKPCSKSIRDHRRFVKIQRQDNLNRLGEFLGTINKRMGLASTKEVFIDLIDLYSIYGKDSDIEVLNSHEQLSYMWNYLNRYWKKVSFGG